MSKKKDAAAASATATASADAAKPAKIIQNGVTRPTAGTSTGRVWEIADSLSAAKGAPAERKEVLDAAAKEGMNAATVATQYGKWREFNGLKGAPRAAKEAPAEPATPGSDASPVVEDSATA